MREASAVQSASLQQSLCCNHDLCQNYRLPSLRCLTSDSGEEMFMVGPFIKQGLISREGSQGASRCAPMGEVDAHGCCANARAPSAGWQSLWGFQYALVGVAGRIPGRCGRPVSSVLTGLHAASEKVSTAFLLVQSENDSIPLEWCQRHLAHVCQSLERKTRSGTERKLWLHSAGRCMHGDVGAL